ncbi:hypothetical protein EJB05_48834, partial [Eragrostis curvula]
YAIAKNPSAQNDSASAQAQQERTTAFESAELLQGAVGELLQGAEAELLRGRRRRRTPRRGGGRLQGTAAEGSKARSRRRATPRRGGVLPQGELLRRSRGEPLHAGPASGCGKHELSSCRYLAASYCGKGALSRCGGRVGCGKHTATWSGERLRQTHGELLLRVRGEIGYGRRVQFMCFIEQCNDELLSNVRIEAHAAMYQIVTI